jgi:phosphatidylserine decarboxylase
MLTIWFFRDPERVLPDKKNVVVSPCDGLILKIETASLPEELNSDDSSEYTKISTFINVTDMHVQRIPVDGTIKQIEYIKGTFINASLDKASKDNERNLVLMEAKNGDTICIVQIAGFVARRIVCDVKKDEVCKVGERYGMIKFGSRIELYIPKRYKVEVLAGQRLVCGETVVASWK